MRKGKTLQKSGQALGGDAACETGAHNEKVKFLQQRITAPDREFAAMLTQSKATPLPQATIRRPPTCRNIAFRDPLHPSRKIAPTTQRTCRIRHEGTMLRLARRHLE